MAANESNKSKTRDKWSDEQKAKGDRIKSVAKEIGIGLKELHSALSRFPGVTLSPDAFEHALNGRVTPSFAAILDAATDVLTEKRDEKENKLNPATKQELDLNKLELRHFIINGDANEQFELHELERRIKEPAIARIEQEGARYGWKLSRYDWGDGLSNPSFDKDLLTSPPKIVIENKTKEWLAHEYWSPHISGFVISDARKKSPLLTNDLKIRIASDFIGQPQVVLQPTRYFSSLATDQIAWSRFTTTKTRPDGTPEDILWDGVSAFIDEKNGQLKGFDRCKVSNQLGASVMAFTQDGEILIVHQNKHNHQSGGRQAPSGSGSLDWADVGEKTDFLDVVRCGAKRELEEECVLIDPKGQYPTLGCEVVLTGFVRMVHRAGKPEFFGLARIDGKADDIWGRRPERYVEKVFSPSIEKANWKTPASPQIARMCRSYLEYPGPIPLSYPLQHLLNHLVEVCEDPERATVINAFMAVKT